ncbi:MAG: hypothetical protein J6N15_04230 [Ruminiclostridium sp.]|nr:hypothetical protein [Ruminiclostridium sp.]
MAIKKHNVTIDNYAVPRVSGIQVYQFVRSETSTTSFAGSQRVDRSAPKFRVIMTVAIADAAQMQTLNNFAKAITNQVTFPFGNGYESKTMIIKLPTIPEPIKAYGSVSGQSYYKDLTLEMEEV